jgi:CRP-like cAMP-binding protein
MSMVLWDTFTGNAPYREILWRMFHPSFFIPLLGQFLYGLIPGGRKLEDLEKQAGSEIEIGKIYSDGEFIIRQGEEGNCMFVIRSGKVSILREVDGKEMQLATLKKGDFFGEMALFEKEVRSTSVRAFGQVRAITIDKKTFLQRIQEDPSIAFRILKMMSFRIRELNHKVSQPPQVE